MTQAGVADASATGIEETEVDSSDNTPAAEESASGPPPRQDDADAGSSDRQSASPGGPDAAIAPSGAPSGEHPPQDGAADGPPRPRRRRRRRRKPISGGPRDTATIDVPMTADGSSPSATDAGGADSAVAGEGTTPERPILRLRHRPRRRHRAHAPGLLPGNAEPGGSAEGTASAAVDAAPGEVASGAAPAQRSFRVPRRRRRHAPLAAAPSAAAPGEAASGESAGAPAEGSAGAEPGNHPPRPRNRRRRAGPRTASTGDTAERQSRDDRAPAQRGAAQGPRARRDDRRPGPGEPSDGARPGASRDSRPDSRRERVPRANQPDGRRDRRDGPPGRGRGAPPRAVERKLYHVDAVVDRGFDDVEEDAGTRRVHWTIVKRTTADQMSRKPLSAAYVLQRDGADSEFPNLGAARAAVNKTIVHPEKLTRSKAEYAAEKNAKK